MHVPTVLREEVFQVRFYSSDGAEKPHVHVVRGKGRAKFWLSPFSLAWARGLNAPDLASARKIVEANQKKLEAKWHEYFSGN